MSRIIAIAIFFSYLTPMTVSINHWSAEAKIHYSYAKHHICRLFFSERFIYQATRLANLSPSTFFIIFLEKLLSLERYLNKGKFLPKANTLAI